MPDCDILLGSPMCTSLSRCNFDPRPLDHKSRTDPKEASGATTDACLAYVASRRPRAVVLETVLGRAPRPEGPGGQPVAPGAAGLVAAAKRQMAPVLARLEQLGYRAVTDVADPRKFGPPQSRQRVYAVAANVASAPRAHMLSEQAVHFPGAAGRITLADCRLR